MSKDYIKLELEELNEGKEYILYCKSNDILYKPAVLIRKAKDNWLCSGYVFYFEQDGVPVKDNGGNGLFETSYDRYWSVFKQNFNYSAVQIGDLL